MGGTIFNCVMILLGSTIGSLFKKGIKERYQEVIMQAMGLAATALGIHAIVKYMPASEYPVLFIVSLAIGGLVGEKLELEAKFKRLVQRFSKTNLAEGLSTAILLFCIGSLSILGPVEAALHGNYTYLFTNGILDGITSIVLATTFGIGIAFAAIVLFLWQGFFYLGALYMESYLTTALLAEISIIGGVLILASGLSILGIKKFNTINLLPSLLVPFLFFIGLHIVS
ncbi:DUF554 domain-containing protein [Lederbergia ruris]|uniref:Membrane protein YdfK n=1 Tax=Lederbergia ruris TaxID=217495 RepID=A0ABQ4KKN1_9BACI|nr:DUF554 domain-containing protein [Lederbergia ruris]GIN58512.1 putative membrane protein YdfK [Lederbergia ruris]